MNNDEFLLAVDVAKFTLKNSAKYFYFTSDKSDKDNQIFIIGSNGNSIYMKLDLQTYDSFESNLKADVVMDSELNIVLSKKNITANNEDVSMDNLVNTLTFFSKIFSDISNTSLNKKVITNVIKYIIRLRGVHSDVVLDTLINEICENINLDKNILSMEFKMDHFAGNNADCGDLVEKK